VKHPNISTMRFSASSRDAIKDIKRIQGAANLLATVLAGSVLFEIFIGNGALSSANNIREKDWETWAKAMRAVPNMVRASINRIAREQLLKFPGKSEREFWEAIEHGSR